MSILLNIAAELIQLSRKLARCPLIHIFLKMSLIYDPNTCIISFPTTTDTC